MGLMKLIDKHKKSTKKSASLREKICKELSSYIKTILPIDELTYTNDLQKKINEHYKFQIPINYVNEAIEEIYRQESMKHIKD